MNKHERKAIRKPEDILEVVKKWKNQRQENFLAITLNGAHDVIKVHHVSKGLVNKTIVHPRECFWPAVKDLATAVVFVHNHPSGNREPSKEDREITQRLGVAGVVMGINVLDHVIITPNDSFYSLRQNDSYLLRSDCDYKEMEYFANILAAESRSA